MIAKTDILLLVHPEGCPLMEIWSKMISFKSPIMLHFSLHTWTKKHWIGFPPKGVPSILCLAFAAFCKSNFGLYFHSIISWHSQFIWTAQLSQISQTKCKTCLVEQIYFITDSTIHCIFTRLSLTHLGNQKFEVRGVPNTR